MKKIQTFSVALLALATAFAITSAAFASGLCPNTAATGGDGTGTFTSGSGCTETMSIPNSENYAKLTWNSSSTGYPASLTFGNLGGVTSSVDLTSGDDQPYFMLALTNPGDSFLNTATGDQILLIEFQGTTLSGPDGDTLALDPTTTEFNLYDNTLGHYLESGQADTNTIDGWIAADSGLGSDDIQEIRIGLGNSGGSGSPESLTVYSADVTETPEPSSLFLLGTGLLGAGGLLYRRRNKGATSLMSAA
jgi:hypothetical protein